MGKQKKQLKKKSNAGQFEKINNFQDINRFFYHQPYAKYSQHTFKVSRIYPDDIYVLMHKIKLFRDKKDYESADDLRDKIVAIGYSEREKNWTDPIRDKLHFVVDGHNLSIKGWIIINPDKPGEWNYLYYEC